MNYSLMNENNEIEIDDLLNHFDFDIDIAYRLIKLMATIIII